MKNIVILGPSRVGKSTLASLIYNKYGFTYISGDSIRNAFINIYPELGYNTKNTINRIEFCKFINWIIHENNIHLKRNIYYVIDSADISIENAKEVFKDSLIIAIGTKDTTVNQMIDNIKKNDTKLEWTYGYSDRELSDIANEIIQKSKIMYEECLANNIPYFDTSINRNQELDKICQFVEKEMDLINNE